MAIGRPLATQPLGTPPAAGGGEPETKTATAGADAAVQRALASGLSLDADVELRQWLRPVADVSAGAWAPSAGADLFATVDEEVADDGDWDATGSASTMELRLTAATDPSSSANHAVRYRAKGDGATDLVVALKQGATTIASWTETGVPAAETTFEHVLSGAQADAITDYSDLRLSVEAA